MTWSGGPRPGCLSRMLSLSQRVGAEGIQDFARRET